MNATASREIGRSTPGEAIEWRHARLAMLAYLTLVMYVYRDTALSMVEIWSRSDTFTHCFLIVPISLWLIWRRRQSLARMRPQVDPSALFVLALAGSAWLVGELGSINALTQFSLVALIVLGVPVILGYRIAIAIAYPLAFLFFAVPFGEFVMPQMMEWTADVTVLALRASGIPVFREGLQFVIPTGNWSVVEACSGVRYLIASFTVGTLFAYLNYRSTTRRLVFTAISILVPVVANWMRAYFIVMLGHLSSNRLAVGVDHLIYGWVFFGVVIMIMFAIGARWSEDPAEEPNPEPRLLQHERPRLAVLLPVTALIAGAMTALPNMLGAWISAKESKTGVILGLQANVADWRVEGMPLAPLRPAFENPSAEQHITFKRGDEAVGLYLAFFRNQGLGRKMVSSNSVLVTNQDPLWAQVAGGSREVPIAGKLVPMKVAELRGGALQTAAYAGRWIAWQVYWIDGHWTASEGMAKAYTVWSRLLGRGDDSAIVVMYGAKGSKDPNVFLDNFAAAALPAIEAALRKAQASR